MPDDINNPQQQNQQPNQGFVTKPVVSSVLSPAVSQPAISPTSLPTQTVQPSGLKGFYRTNKYYFWAIFAGLLIIAVLAYFAFRKVPQAPVAEANVSINVDVPQSVASGGEAVYKITTQNNDSQKLVNMELEVAYPDGIVYQSSSPNAENLSGSLFIIPDLIPGQNAVIFLKTKVVGNVNDQLALNFKLHYKYANFNSEFVKQQSSLLTLVASDVTIELDGPSTTNNAQVVLYNIKYQNNSDEDIKSARVKMDYPGGFVFASSNPPPSLGSDTWDVGSLPKNAAGEIQIQGTFTAINPGDSKTANAQFLILGNDGQFFTQNHSSFTTTVSSLPLLVSQELSPVNSSNVVNPGDDLNFSIRYQNNGSTAANGVNIVAALDSKAVDLSSIKAEGGQISNNTISWNAATVPQLENLAPNESGQLSFSLHINNPATKDSSKNLTLVSNIKIKSNGYDSFFPGNPLTLKISSPSAIARTLSFVSGQQPPQVGRSTTYKVRLTLSNSSNDYTNGVLTAFIAIDPGSFVSSSVTSAEKNNLQFDSSTGKIIWNVGSLNASTGRFGPPKVLEFQLTLNPAAAMAHTSPTLVKNISFTAKDAFTQQDINITADNLDTNNIAGNNGFGDGQVQQ